MNSQEGAGVLNLPGMQGHPGGQPGPQGPRGRAGPQYPRGPQDGLREASDRALSGRRGGGGPLARPAPAPFVAAAVAMAALMLTPLVYLAVRAVPALQSGWEWLLNPRILQLVQGSLGLALAVSAAAVALSVPLAWLLTRTDLPGKQVWLALLTLPLAMPSYVGAFALIAALQPGGAVDAALGPLKPFLGDAIRLPRLEGIWGAAFALTLFTFPYVLLPVRAAWSRLDPTLDEAARSMGLGPAAVIRRVTLPQLRPVIASGALLVALYVLSDFGAVSLLRFDTLTLAIYVQYSASFNRSRAALLALILVALTVALYSLERGTRRRQAMVLFRTQPGTARVARLVRLGFWKVPATLVAGGVVAVAVGLPVTSLVYWLVRGLGEVENLRTLSSAAAGSVLVAALAAGATAVAAFPIAWLSARYSGRLTRTVEQVTYLSHGLPGIVLALSLVFFGANYLRPLYQTLPLLVLAHMVHFMPQAVGAQSGAVAQLNPHLEEVARSLGRGPLQVLRRVTVPLLRPGWVAGASLVFLSSIKELPATLLLSPTGFRTLATLTWSNAAEGFFTRAALPGLVLILVSGIAVALLLRQNDGPDARWRTKP